MGVLVAVPAFAQSNKKPVWFHPAVMLGMGSSVASTDPTKTSVGMTTAGATMGVRIKQKFLLGFAVDYRFITQLSDYDPNVGNRRGNSLTYVSPLLGFELGSVTIKGMYHFMGNYSLQNTTTTGQKLSYEEPSGFRVELMIGLKFKLKPILFYESIKFSKQLLDGTATSTQIPVTLSNYGLGFSYPF